LVISSVVGACLLTACAGMTYDPLDNSPLQPAPGASQVYPSTPYDGSHTEHPGIVP